MTEIERKALAWVNEVEENRGWARSVTVDRHFSSLSEALCRAIERVEELETTERDCIDCDYAKPLMELQAEFEAFRREVSDALVEVRDTTTYEVHPKLWRFILPKPDPLVDAVDELWTQDMDKAKYMADQLHKYLAARGLEVRKIEESE